MTGLRAKVDRSLGITLNTPELTSQEKAEFMELQSVNLTVTLEPLDEPTEEYKIDKEIETKTPSQRIRSVLYVYWQQQGSDGDFNDFYRTQMEKFINVVKTKLE